MITERGEINFVFDEGFQHFQKMKSIIIESLAINFLKKFVRIK